MYIVMVSSTSWNNAQEIIFNVPLSPKGSKKSKSSTPKVVSKPNPRKRKAPSKSKSKSKSSSKPKKRARKNVPSLPENITRKIYMIVDPNSRFQMSKVSDLKPMISNMRRAEISKIHGHTQRGMIRAAVKHGYRRFLKEFTGNQIADALHVYRNHVNYGVARDMLNVKTRKSDIEHELAEAAIQKDDLPVFKLMVESVTSKTVMGYYANQAEKNRAKKILEWLHK